MTPVLAAIGVPNGLADGAATARVPAQEARIAPSSRAAGVGNLDHDDPDGVHELDEDVGLDSDFDEPF